MGAEERADEFAVPLRPERGPAHGTVHERGGATRVVAAGEGPGGVGRGIRQAHLLADHLHGAEAAGEDEHHGGDDGGELGSDAARVPAPVTPR